MKPYDVLYVTGVTCSGKTTLANEMRARSVPRTHIAEVDNGQMPEAGHGHWLRWRGEQLLHEAAQRWLAKAGEATVICGIAWPHAVIDSQAFADLPKDMRVGFLLLDIPTSVLSERLSDRVSDPDKRTAEKAYRDLYRPNRRLAKALRRQVANQKHGRVLKVGDLSPTEVADVARKLIYGRPWTPLQTTDRSPA